MLLVCSYLCIIFVLWNVVLRLFRVDTNRTVLICGKVNTYKGLRDWIKRIFCLIWIGSLVYYYVRLWKRLNKAQDTESWNSNDQLDHPVFLLIYSESPKCIFYSALFCCNCQKLVVFCHLPVRWFYGLIHLGFRKIFQWCMCSSWCFSLLFLVSS